MYKAIIRGGLLADTEKTEALLLEYALHDKDPSVPEECKRGRHVDNYV